MRLQVISFKGELKCYLQNKKKKTKKRTWYIKNLNFDKPFYVVPTLHSLPNISLKVGSPRDMSGGPISYFLFFKKGIKHLKPLILIIFFKVKKKNPLTVSALVIFLRYRNLRLTKELAQAIRH